ncbi:C39 family peptidase [Rhodococcus sp. KRD162]|uniref:C39 family peptidase n=1 Tax=Rhodococcus sp. KRD162 TaxID=2729725 RepID=UPI0019D2F1AA|nr:C39 family peptidase [Rhodococcus sp. KRD162]
MPDIVLPHNVSIIPQETSYWCGPASCQVAFDVRGINSTEADLARQLGTTRNGTSHIGLITDLLNRNVPADYITRQIPGNDATKEQTELLWRDVQASILGGYAVVCNVMVPPSNYPRGTRGEKPAYGGGMVYHYFTVVGCNPDTRECFVADSGFRPYSYWMSVDQLASCIAGKGYTATPNEKPIQPAPPLDTRSPADIELSKRFQSRSKYRTNDDAIDTLAGFVLNIDGRIHERSVERARGEL